MDLEPNTVESKAWTMDCNLDPGPWQHQGDIGTGTCTVTGGTETGTSTGTGGTEVTEAGKRLSTDAQPIARRANKPTPI